MADTRPVPTGQAGMRRDPMSDTPLAALMADDRLADAAWPTTPGQRPTGQHPAGRSAHGR